MAEDLPAAGLRARAEAARAGGDPAGAAAWQRRAVAAADATDEDRRRLAAMLAALGFAGRAAALGHGPATPPRRPARPVDPDGVHIYLSTPQAAPDGSDRAALGRRIGTADYSYGFAMRGFVAALARLGVAHTVLSCPEQVADIRDRSPAACNIHLGFTPPERLRLLKGAYNILCCAWEFDRLRLPGEVIDPHAFADQATMLRLPDELWVPSAHGAAAIARGVATPVRVVPSPVPARLRAGGRRGPPGADAMIARARLLDAVAWQPLAIAPRAQGAADRHAASNRRPLSAMLAGLLGAAGGAPPAIFVTVLNVHDYRKQLAPMLRGFAGFARERPDALLLVKASTPAHGRQPLNSLLLAEQIEEPGAQARPVASDRIWITDDVLTAAEMAALYDVAAFYMSTAHAEGQNLPLLEAMGRGVVPVSVDHTAMADYVRADNAVPVRSRRRPFGIRLSRRYGMYGLETNFVDPADVRAALAKAMALTPAAYAARALAAHATVRDRYGPERLAGALRDVLPAARARTARRG